MREFLLTLFAYQNTNGFCRFRISSTGASARPSQDASSASGSIDFGRTLADLGLDNGGGSATNTVTATTTATATTTKYSPAVVPRKQPLVPKQSMRRVSADLLAQLIVSDDDPYGSQILGSSAPKSASASVDGFALAARQVGCVCVSLSPCVHEAGSVCASACVHVYCVCG